MRKLLTDEENPVVTLEKLIPQYAMNKAELDSYKKICDKENAEIKNKMLELNINEKQVGGYVAKRIIQKRESINEDMLIEIAHQFGIPEIIKTKEYIDYDILENAIYTGKISKEILMEIDKARETKEVVTLRVMRIKSETKGE